MGGGPDGKLKSLQWNVTDTRLRAIHYNSRGDEDVTVWEVETGEVDFATLYKFSREDKDEWRDDKDKIECKGFSTDGDLHPKVLWSEDETYGCVHEGCGVHILRRTPSQKKVTNRVKNSTAGYRPPTCYYYRLR